MRKITMESVNALYNKQNLNKQNMTVRYFEDTNVTIIYLHGNVIANLKDGELRIFDGGWQTNTTKERLNGILDRTNYYVFQKNYNWYIGNRETKEIVDFKNGFTIKL